MVAWTRWTLTSHTHPHAHTRVRTPRGDSPWQCAQCVTKPHSCAFPDSESGIRLAEWNFWICRRWLCVFVWLHICVYLCLRINVACEAHASSRCGGEGMLGSGCTFIGLYMNALQWAPGGQYFMVAQMALSAVSQFQFVDNLMVLHWMVIGRQAVYGSVLPLLPQEDLFLIKC